MTDPLTASAIERPAAGPRDNGLWGSDVIADVLRDLDIPYIALNPGASYRGLHDSLVNHLGNAAPRMLVCLHEEHAVAIAHGYAKVTGRAMAAAVHSNVGLMHATMAIFNAWCDRMPVLVIGATGPVDAAKRRPWIDWIHTARDQGALVRAYTKWDDQPASAAAAREAILRGAWLAEQTPKGPVYINLDAGLQEQKLDEPIAPVDAARFRPQVAAGASTEAVADIARWLGAATAPVILAGRASRDETAWERRVRLAERLGARVLTDLKIGASFPTDHPLHAGSPGVFPVPAAITALTEADVILSLDWVDLAGTLKTAFGPAGPSAQVIQVSLDQAIHNGWSMDYQGLAPVDLFVAADPDSVLAPLLDALGAAAADRRDAAAPSAPPVLAAEAPERPLVVDDVSYALQRELVGRDVCLLHLPLSWNGATWPLRHPLDFVGSDGGGGIGGGPGISIGAALALRDAGGERLPLAICGDGDFMMGSTAIWTAAHYRIPLLFVVVNNQSFYNDEVHQERMARERGRPVENKWIGQRMTDPEIDIAALSRAQGAVGFGPIRTVAEFEAVLPEALAGVAAGAVVVIDVRVEPGYTPAMASSLTRHD